MDAHWGEELPLKKEVEQITNNYLNYLICIDDFAVPNDNSWGFDSYEGTDIDTWNTVQTFQNPNGNNYSNGVDKMYNSYFASPGTARNGSIYCYVGDASGGLSSPCENNYTGSTAGLDLQGRMYDFSPRNLNK